MLKWKYVHIPMTIKGEFNGTAYPNVMKPDAKYDTPEEAFAALQNDFKQVWDSKTMYQFFLKWEEVPDPPDPNEQVWKLEVRDKHAHSNDRWRASKTYPNTYTQWEADALVEVGNKSQITVYRKVIA